MLELSINAKTMRMENLSKWKNVLLFVGAALFLFNFLILDEVNIAEESIGLSEDQIEEEIDKMVRNYEHYEHMNELERQKLRRIYTKGFDEVIAEDNREDLDMENKAFTFRVTFLNGFGVFIRGFGQWIDVLEVKVKGDSFINNYPKAQREKLESDPSPWHKKVMASLGYAVGKHFAFNIAALLILAALSIKRLKKGTSTIQTAVH